MQEHCLADKLSVKHANDRFALFKSPDSSADKHPDLPPSDPFHGS